MVEKNIMLLERLQKKNLGKINILAKKYDLDFFIIGKVIDGIGKVFIDYPHRQRKLLKTKGFIHLS